MFIKKFYSPDGADAAGGDTDTAVIDTKPETVAEVKEKPLSFAEQMAKGGSKVTGDTPQKTDKKVETPIVNTEIKEEPKLPAKDVPPVETTTELQDAETKAKPEPQAQKPEETLATKPPIAEQPKPTQSLQEVLKSQQPNDVLKELGFDDKMVEIINELKDYDKKDFFSQFLKALKGGNANDYVKEWNTDYSKMSAEDVMRHQLRVEYPKASEKALNALYEDEVTNKYNLNSEDDELSEKGKLLLEAKADKYRDSLIENQKLKLAPTPPEPKAPVVDNSAAEKAQQEVEAYKNKITTDPYFKDLNASNEIVLGKGKDEFKYPVDATELSDLLFDGEKWSKSLLKPTEDGSATFVPDVKKQMLIAAVAKYGEDFFDKYAKHYKSLGGKAAIEPLNNAKPPDTQNVSLTEVKPQNLAEGMAKGGVKVTAAM